MPVEILRVMYLKFRILLYSQVIVSMAMGQIPRSTERIFQL